MLARPSLYPTGSEPPCVYTVGPSCTAVPRQESRVAICLAGGVRTFARPHVHRSIATNLISGLDAHVDVFAILRLADVSPKGSLEEREHSRVDASRADLKKALAALGTALRSVVLDNSSSSVYGVKHNPKCELRGFMGKSYEHGMRSVAQPASWARCLDHIEEAERGNGGVQYDWVIRSRPDAYWFAPHPPACALPTDAIMAHVWNDLHFVLPRQAATLVLRGMLSQYTSCDGRFIHETPERWLHAAMSSATTSDCAAAAARGRTKRGQLVFPFSLVRRNAHEPDAWMGCAQNYIVPYGLANKSANPCEGDHSESALKKMHASLLKCIRWAYPEEVIEPTYHKAHVVLALRGGACPDWLKRAISPAGPINSRQEAIGIYSIAL